MYLDDLATIGIEFEDVHTGKRRAVMGGTMTVVLPKTCAGTFVGDPNGVCITCCNILNVDVEIWEGRFDVCEILLH